MNLRKDHYRVGPFTGCRKVNPRAPILSRDDPIRSLIRSRSSRGGVGRAAPFKVAVPVNGSSASRPAAPGFKRIRRATCAEVGRASCARRPLTRRATVGRRRRVRRARERNFERTAHAVPHPIFKQYDRRTSRHGDGARVGRPAPAGNREAPRPRARASDAIMWNTTPNGGSLGTWVDEGRRKMRVDV